MPRYRLTGTHRATGRRIQPAVVDADDPADARRRGENAGIAVDGVEQMTTDETRTLSPTDPTDSYRALGSPPGP